MLCNVSTQHTASHHSHYTNDVNNLHGYGTGVHIALNPCVSEDDVGGGGARGGGCRCGSGTDATALARRSSWELRRRPSAPRLQFCQRHVINLKT